MLVALLAASAFLAIALFSARETSSGWNGERPLDRFGISKLYPSRDGGLSWEAEWNRPRRFSRNDPADAWFHTDYGSGAYTARNGELRIGGAHPRMHVYRPDLKRQWGDVEITMYFKRVADTNIRYAGMVAVARTNHGVTGEIRNNPCDSRGIGARMRYDGRIDFEKETSHPDNMSAAEKVFWPRGLPHNRWIGYKYVVYDRANGDVQLELWIDLAEGRDGGSWVKVNELLDDGSTFGDEPCAPGVDPRLRLGNDPHREGSESGKPNLSVYFRTDGVGKHGLVYKWGSIRDISVAGR